MKQHSDSDNASNDNLALKLVIAIIATVIATVLVMEKQGLIKHSSNKDDFALSQYQAILIEQEQEGQYRLSHKPSNQHARCIEGFLFIQSDSNSAMKGLLVDYKNRGVKCTPTNLTQSRQNTNP